MFFGRSSPQQPPPVPLASSGHEDFLDELSSPEAAPPPPAAGAGELVAAETMLKKVGKDTPVAAAGEDAPVGAVGEGAPVPPPAVLLLLGARTDG